MGKGNGFEENRRAKRPGESSTGVWERRVEGRVGRRLCKKFAENLF